jgi:DNA-binding MarR family transcriptional regulator
MLLDREMLVATEGRYQLTGDLAQLGVAETLQALIASRLDANRPEDRGLLLDASVLGQSFTVDALAAVAGVEPSDLADRLDRLVRRELLTVEADLRSPERGQYLFVQALVREIAYQNLAKADRRQRHLAAARYFEGIGSDELAGVLATHYLAAYRSSRAGDEADALAAQARIALQAAAERASALHSHRQALGHLELALTVTTDPAEMAILHLRAAESEESAGDLANGQRHAEQARELYQSVGDAHGALRAATWVGRHQTSQKLEALAIPTFETAIAEADQIHDSAEFAEALAELSRVYMMTQRSGEAVATADQALELAGRHGLMRATVEALINKGTALSGLGRSVEAESVLRGAIAVADRNALPLASLRARNNLQIALIDDGPATLAFMREGRDLSVRFGVSNFRNQFVTQLADLANRMGEGDEVFDEIDAIEEAEQLHPFYQSAFAATRALHAALGGDLERAAVEVANSESAAKELRSVMVDRAIDLLHAEMANLHGDWPTGARLGLAAAANVNFVLDGAICAAQAGVAGDLRDELRAAIEVHRRSPLPGALTEAALTAAEAGLAAREGRWDEADAGYRRALDAFHVSGYRVTEAWLNLQWGALAGSRNAGAAAAAEAGAAFFINRGAASVVDRYRQAFVPVDGEATPKSSKTAGARSRVPSA